MFGIRLTLCLLLAFGQTLFAAERTLVAEGDYVAQTKDGSKPLAHWKLWRLDTGEYEVLESPATGTPVVQTFRFDDKFLPVGYTLKIGEIQGKSQPIARPMTVTCQFKIEELRCDADYDGHKSQTSMPAKQPYVFMPGEFYGLDFCWFLTGVVRLTSRSKASEPVNVYVMTDRSGHPGEIGLKLDDPIKLTPAGEQTADVLGKSQVVKRYEWLGPEEVSQLRVTSKGLVSSMGGKANPSLGFAISGYKEYEPWGPDH